LLRGGGRLFFAEELLKIGLLKIELLKIELLKIELLKIELLKIELLKIELLKIELSRIKFLTGDLRIRMASEGCRRVIAGL